MDTVFVVGARGIPDIEGGVEKAVERIFPLFAERGWRVVVAGLRKKLNGTEFRGVELYPVTDRQLLGTDKIGYYLIATVKAARMKPDIVHLAGLGAALFLSAYKVMGCKVIVRYGSADYLLSKWGWLGRLGFRLAEYQLRFADAIIAVTPALAERLRSKGIAKNVHIIPNGLDDIHSQHREEKDRGPDDRPYVLAVGRLTGQKNFSTLIEAFRKFRKTWPEFSLKIAGGLTDQKYVQTLGKLPPHVSLLGYVPRQKLYSLYRGAQLYVNCSLHEGHSNAILEAISHGCPTILSDIPENRDFKLTAKFYFDPSSADSIAAAIGRAVRRPAEFRIDRSKQTSWPDIADQVETLFASLVRPGQGASCQDIVREAG